jgi:D-glycero-D-manno-heptose 1,7-bisphosphate phosphatase
MTKKALFLDRDGVINVDHGYVYRPEDFQFIDGIFELSRTAISKGYIICVITNQAGIGRGYYSVADFGILTDWMCKKFEEEKALISKVYFSPYHPLYGIGDYKKDDFSRKPNPGMLLQAKTEFNLDLKRCVLIGDKDSDIEAGISACVGTNLYLNNEACKDKLVLGSYHRIDSICEAKAYL